MNLLKHLTKVFRHPEKMIEKASEAGVPEVLGNPDELEVIVKKSVGWNRHLRKLTEEQQLELVKYIAKGYVGSQVKEKMKETFGVEVSPVLIYKYKNTPKWQGKIKELRAYYKSHLDEIPGTDKAVRIRRMELIMDKANKDGDVRAAISANEQIRKEFDKDSGDINIYHNNPVYQQFNSLTDEELLERQKAATAKLMQRRLENGPDRQSNQKVS